MKKISFNADWELTRGRTGEREHVHLPHDATISEQRDPAIRIGYLCAFYHGGEYTYVKRFSLPQDWLGKAIYLEFEGIYCHSEIFVNGTRAQGCVNGYIPLMMRIDSCLHEG